MNSSENTHNNIRKLRLLRGLSLVDLQDATGINFTWLSRIETGKVIPTEDELNKIKAALNWPSDEAVEAAFQLLQGEPTQ